MMPSDIESMYPLTPLQEGILFHSLSTESSGIYIQQTLCRLRERLDIPCWERAWRQVVQRHGVLRTSLRWQGVQTPVQLVHKSATPSCESYDLRGKSPDEQQHLLQTAVTEDRYTDFDFSAAPLIRNRLYRLADDDYFFLWSFSHAILDGRSRTSLLRELFFLYQSYCEGSDPSLPLPQPFADYVHWLQNQDNSLCQTYWQGLVATFDSPLTFISASKNKNLPGNESCGEVTIHVPAELNSRCEAFAASHQVTLNAFLQAAWALLLIRYCAAQDIVFGATWACRSGLPGIESMVGPLINTLPVRLQADFQMSVIEFVRMVRKQHIGLREHKHIPLNQIESWSGIPSGTRLFESIIVFNNTELDYELHLGNEEAWRHRHFQRLGGPHYPITLLIFRRPIPRLTLHFRNGILTQPQCDQMMTHLQRLLEVCSLNPEQRISELPLLTEPELQQLTSLNQNAVAFREKCVQELFEEQAAKTPQAVAVVYERQSLTYEQLNAQSNQLAHYLRERGVGPEMMVGLCLERSLAMVVGMLAILKAGGAYVPMDPAFPRERLLYILEDGRIRLVLSQAQWRNSIPADREVLAIDQDQELWRDSDLRNPANRTDGANSVYVIYTSGSTGRPKGVVIEHRQLANYVRAISRFIQLRPGCRMAMVSTFCSDLGNTVLFPSLCGGGELHVISDEVARNPGAWNQYCRTCAIESMKVTPSHLESLLNINADRAHSDQTDRSGVPSHLVILGGEASSREWVEKVRKRGGLLCEVTNHYGPTECTVGVLADRVYRESANDADNVPMGRPLANMRVFIVDKNGQLAMPGQPGELWIGGAGVARGYLGKAELTAERFVPDAFSGCAGHRLYRTGDQVRLLSEKIEFLGRIDFQLKIQGFRVELQEIEAALREHTAVTSAVVVALGPAHQKQLIAYVAAKNTTGRELRDYLKSKLPNYMVPSSVVVLERLPLTPNGKTDRHALPPPEEQETQAIYAAPCTPVEEVFAGIWAEALKLGRVGTQDNFFELGGNSLLAIRTLWRMQEALRTEISLQQFVKNPTIAGLARSLASTHTQSPGKEKLALHRRRGNDRIPASFGQERLWFLQQFDLASCAYNMSYMLRLRGRLAVNALEKAVSEIIRRHQVLRTTFAIVDNEPVQIVNPESSLRFPQVSLADLPESEREREAGMLARRQARRPFDLIQGPLICFLLMRMEPEQHILALTTHHIVSDGRSIDVFVQELATLYDAFSRGQASPLPEPPIQYADYADWQKRCAQDNVFIEQLAYWKHQLEGMPESLKLSVAHPRSSVPSHAGARLQFPVSSRVSEFLYAVRRKEGVTLFMMLLSAFHVLLGRYSGLHDVVTGSPIAGRSHSETEGLIGFFVNMLVLRTDLSENLSFRDLLHQVRTMALEAYVNQDVPFEKLVSELRPERDSTRVPLVQAVFALEANQRDRAMGNVALHMEEVANNTSKFDLVLSVTETDQGFRGRFEYNVDLFDTPTVERMAGHFLVLLEAATARPDQTLADLPWLTSDELRQLVLDWNRTETAFTQGRCVHELFEDQAEKTPEAVALVHGHQRLTYRDLNREASQLAWHLRELGIGSEIPVGLCVKRSTDMVVAMLAILKAGGAYLPLDPAYPLEHLSFALRDAGASVLLAHTKWSENLPQAGHKVVFLDQFRQAAGARSALEKLESGVSPDNVAYVIYTSGSTGRPKGVSVTHKNLLNLVFWHQSAFGITANDRTTQVASPAFDASNWELWPYLTAGALVEIVSESARMNPEELQEFIISHAITVSFVPTQVAEQLLRLNWPPSIPLGFLLTGGDRLRTAPAHALPFTLSNNYGPTENTVVATSWPVDSLEKNDHDPAIGRPIANVQAYVLDRQYRPVPIGIPGELYLSGANLSRGYLNRPQFTAERFIPNPFSAVNGARMYATGDLVRYRADGNLEFLGRIDQQVKIRGFRIEPGGIEKVIAEHAMVRDVVVIAFEDTPENQTLVAYIVPRDPEGPSNEELRRFLRTKLPSHMVPSYFVKLAKLPLTANQKLDRAALPPPDRSNTSPNRSYVPPKTAVEEFLVDIWSRVLKVERVGVQDDFFELGGHSLLAAQVLSRIRSILKVDVPLQKLFEAPNVEQLSKAVISRDRKPGQAEKIAKIYKQSLQTSTNGVSHNP